jgi:hypothetical protein
MVHIEVYVEKRITIAQLTAAWVRAVHIELKLRSSIEESSSLNTFFATRK